MIDYTFYCNCFRGHENKSTQFNQKNLMCGSRFFDSDYKQELTDRNFYFDDTGDNISDLNPWLGDLTGLYWIWKNTTDEIVGTNQYRRFWNSKSVESINFDSSTIYVSAHVDLGLSVYEHYSMSHGEIGMYILYMASYLGKIPFTHQQLDRLKQTGYISTCNMFFAHRTLFDKICQNLFEIVFELYHGSKYALPFIQKSKNGRSETRMIAYLAERILTLMYLDHKRFFGDTNIELVDWEVL